MNVQMKAKQQKGFTIIELVVVILLLGILAATALPRFLDVTDEAHEAVVDGLSGGLTTGNALFRAAWVAQREPTTAVAGFGAGNLFANSNGYPIGLDATRDADTCLEVYNNVLQSGRPLAASVSVAFADIGTATAVSTAVDGAAAGVQVAAVTIPVAAADFSTSSECRYYYIGQFPDAPASTAAALTIPLLTLSLTNGEVVKSDFTYQLP